MDSPLTDEIVTDLNNLLQVMSSNFEGEATNAFTLLYKRFKSLGISMSDVEIKRKVNHDNSKIHVVHISSAERESVEQAFAELRRRNDIVEKHNAELKAEIIRLMGLKGKNKRASKDKKSNKIDKDSQIISEKDRMYLLANLPEPSIKIDELLLRDIESGISYSQLRSIAARPNFKKMYGFRLTSNEFASFLRPFKKLECQDWTQRLRHLLGATQNALDKILQTDIDESLGMTFDVALVVILRGGILQKRLLAGMAMKSPLSKDFNRAPVAKSTEKDVRSENYDLLMTDNTLGREQGI